MQITSPCKGLITLSFPAPEVTTLRLTVVQREGGKKSNQDQELYILIKDGTGEGNAILQVQTLKKQHVM